MTCPYCSGKTRVAYVTGNRRRRECLDCKRRFKTIEEVFDPSRPRPRPKPVTLDERQRANMILATDGPWLPIEAWSDWLHDAARRFDTRQEFGWRLGVSPRCLYRWMQKEVEWVSIPMVEAALWSLDVNTDIRIDWRDIWDENEVVHKRPRVRRTTKGRS